MIFQIEKWKNDFSHEFPQGPLWTSRPPRWQQVLRLLPKKATHVAKNFRSCHTGRHAPWDPDLNCEIQPGYIKQLFLPRAQMNMRQRQYSIHPDNMEWNVPTVFDCHESNVILSAHVSVTLSDIFTITSQKVQLLPNPQVQSFSKFYVMQKNPR